MANFDTYPEFTEQVRMFETTDPGHAALFNAVIGALLNNDVFLKKASDHLVHELERHVADKGNPHETDKDQMGIGKVDNTSDQEKPVSTAQQAALDALYRQMTAFTMQKIADLINGAPESMDTLKELSDAIAANKTIMDALDAAVGKKASAAEFDSHVKDAVRHITASERTKWNGKADKTGMSGATASSAGASGLVPAPEAGAANRYLRSDGTWQVPPDNNTTYGNMAAATAGAAGKAGLVPAPPSGAQGKYLTGGATYQNVDDHAAVFTGGDALNPTAWTDVPAMQSGETHKSLFGKISTMFRNVRYLWKVMGSADISAIGDGTVTGALSTLNTGLTRCETVHCGSLLPGQTYSATYSTAAKILIIQAQQSEWGIYGHDVVIPGLYCAFGLNIALETEYRLQIRGNVWQDNIQVYYSYVTGGLDTQKIFLDVFGIL